MSPTPAFLPVQIDLPLLRLVERTATSLALLNGTISRGLLAESWLLQARWSGYARALQLQAVEIDEIDVISWACGVPIPGRARFDTLIDPFEGFAAWSAACGESDDRHWREDLPFTPSLPPEFSEAPLLLRAIALTGQYARADATMAPWLALPVILHRFGLTTTPLPCLVSGDKGFRLRPRDGDAIVRRVLRDLDVRAADGLRIARNLDAERRRWIRVLAGERKPGALRTLAALTLRQPVFRPEALARMLGLTPSGAGKLLERAAGHGFLQEVSGRGSWRVYMVPDLARRLGFVSPLRGRPASPPPLPRRDHLGESLADFDAEMAALVARFPNLRFSDDASADG